MQAEAFAPPQLCRIGLTVIRIGVHRALPFLNTIEIYQITYYVPFRLDFCYIRALICDRILTLLLRPLLFFKNHWRTIKKNRSAFNYVLFKLFLGFFHGLEHMGIVLVLMKGESHRRIVSIHLIISILFLIW